LPVAAGAGARLAAHRRDVRRCRAGCAAERAAPCADVRRMPPLAARAGGLDATSLVIRWTGAALFLGGVCLASFVLVLYPVGGFFGAAHALHPAWVPAHSLHLVGALLTLFGLLGLYACHASRLGRVGAIGFVLALAGTAQFVGTGMLTTFVWPVLAASAPETLEPRGALF